MIYSWFYYFELSFCEYVLLNKFIPNISKVFINAYGEMSKDLDKEDLDHYIRIEELEKAGGIFKALSTQSIYKHYQL